MKVVDAFSAAIKAAKIEEAGKLLDAKALVLESGGTEPGRVGPCCFATCAKPAFRIGFAGAVWRADALGRVLTKGKRFFAFGDYQLL